jgi:hypothetical protein
VSKKEIDAISSFGSARQLQPPTWNVHQCENSLNSLILKLSARHWNQEKREYPHKVLITGSLKLSARLLGAKKDER